MSSHNCDALVVTCIDFRFQHFINDWIRDKHLPKTFDRVALAGGVFNWEVIENQVDISKRLHNIHTVILMNHEDCGAYGEAGTHARHEADLKAAAATLRKKYPEIKVVTYLIQLSGDFTQIEA
jgi:carbonic anhydrase